MINRIILTRKIKMEIASKPIDSNPAAPENLQMVSKEKIQLKPGTTKSVNFLPKKSEIKRTQVKPKKTKA
tara:strand:- start:33018 stop:33227 length:210 start_codon:yes stop_codon:yes gene_type:complete